MKGLIVLVDGLKMVARIIVFGILWFLVVLGPIFFLAWVLP